MDSAGLFNKLKSHAQAMGIFEAVTTHEPKTAPGSGHSYSLWLDKVAPATGISGLASTAGLFTFMARIYQNMLKEPQDDIDIEMLTAFDKLTTRLFADLTLDSTVMVIDIRGIAGTSYGGRAAYVPQDGRLYRCFDITIPVIVDDVWPEIP